MMTTRMPTVLHQDSADQFRIIPHLPLYQFCSYSNCWTRILMMEEGHYLRIRLTPSNPTVESEWTEMLGARLDLIQWGGRIWGTKDLLTRTLPVETVQEIHDRLGSVQADRLLTGNIWAQIQPLWPKGYERPYEIKDWLSRCGYNDGIPLAQIQKTPPTHAEFYAAEERKRQEKRQARIATAVGTADPLTEEEHQLGMSLEGHDWAYSYSDDGQVWKRGQDHREELERSLKALPPERARIVWKAFVHPSNEQYWRCPV